MREIIIVRVLCRNQTSFYAKIHDKNCWAKSIMVVAHCMAVAIRPSCSKGLS